VEFVLYKSTISWSVHMSDPSIVAFLKSRGAAKCLPLDSKEHLMSAVSSTIESRAPQSSGTGQLIMNFLLLSLIAVLIDEITSFN